MGWTKPLSPGGWTPGPKDFVRPLVVTIAHSWLLRDALVNPFSLIYAFLSSY